MPTLFGCLSLSLNVLTWFTKSISFARSGDCQIIKKKKTRNESKWNYSARLLSFFPVLLNERHSIPFFSATNPPKEIENKKGIFRRSHEPPSVSSLKQWWNTTVISEEQLMIEESVESVLWLWCKSVHMGRNKRKQDETLENSVNDDESIFFLKKKKTRKKKETSLAWATETH